MNSYFRKFLLIFSFLSFFLAGVYLVIKTQGFVFDWGEFAFVRTGGIYLRFLPHNASITINGNNVKNEGGIFRRGTLIKNLRPDTYSVSISAPGRDAWNKNLEVLPGLVSAESFVVLWEKTHDEEIIYSSSSKAHDFWMTKPGIVIKADDEIKFEDTTIRGNAIEDGNPRFGQVITKNETNFFFTDLPSPESSINLNSLFYSLKNRQLSLPGIVPIEKILLHPFSEHKVIISTKSSVYELDLKKVSLTKIFTSSSTITNTFAGNQEIFALDSDGTLFSSNLVINSTSQFSISSSTPKKIASVRNGTAFLVLDQEENLVLYEKNPFTKTAIESNVSSFWPSPSENRIAILKTDGSLSVYYLENITRDVAIKKGTSVKSAVSQKKNEHLEVFWDETYPQYLFIHLGGSLLATEIDTRFPLNTSVLANEVKKVFWLNEPIVLKNDGSMVKIRNLY